MNYENTNDVNTNAAAPAAEATTTFQPASATTPAGFAVTDDAPKTMDVSKLATADSIVAAFDDLKARRENWEMHQLRASNDVLYSILGDCYAIYGRTQKSDKLREQFLAAYEAKYGKCKANTSIATKIIWAVFGKQLEQRAYNYSYVLRTVYQNLKTKPGKAFSEYVIEVGGLEEIRRNGGNTEALKAQRDAERQIAIANLNKNVGIAKGLQIQLSEDQQEKNAEHSFRAALIREEADGTFTIVMVSSSEVPVNSMITEFSKRKDQQPAPAAAGTTEALEELEQLISQNVNA